MQFITRDIRHACRTLRSSPALVVVATLSLGLGAGVNTTLYSVFDTVFLRPPTAIAPERLMRIEPGNSNQISWLNFRDLVPGGAWEEFAAYAITRLNLRSSQDVEKVTAMLVSPGYFELLGVKLSLGRTFSPQEESAAVITERFRQSRFSGTTNPLGAVLNLNGTSFTIVGVFPKDYRAVTGVMSPDIYVPIGRPIAPAIDKRNQAFLTLLGRLGPGMSAQRGEAAFTAQSQALERIHPEDNRDLGRGSFLFPVSGLGSWRQRSMPMSSLVAITAIPFAIFGLVLLIACANVAGLLLARGAARRREIAIRLAMGSTRSRLIGTLLAESLVLSLLGSLAGLLLSYWLCAFVSTIPLPQVNTPVEISPDLSVLLYALFLALATTLACGLTPAMASTRLQLTDGLKREAAPHSRLGGRSVLVSGQVALSTVLLFVSTLFLRSLDFITRVDPGFNITNVVTANIELDRHRYPEPQRLLFASQAVQTAQTLPGVIAASITNLIPLGGDVYSSSYQAEGQAIARVRTYEMKVGPDYFRTMETRLHLGREFTTADRAGAAPVAIVNQAFLRAMSLGRNPIGAHVRSRATDPWIEITGVVADSKYAFFGEAPHPILYRPFLQTGGNLILTVRTVGTPESMIPALKRALMGLDKSAIVEARSIRDATSLEFSLRRMGAWILGAIGVLGLALALTGLYGVMSYMVNRRTAEIGIRMALGAPRPAILWMVLRNGVRLTGIGISVGLLISMAAARPLASLMSGISTLDPLTMAITATLLLVTGIAASYVPSRRATLVDPLSMLRSE